jgi:NADH dehydrogenase
MAEPHVVIIGGGFGGLYAARAFGARRNVTMVDRRNHHVFQPLLTRWPRRRCRQGHRVADPVDPGRQRNVQVLLADVVAIDAAARRFTLTDGALDYDYLIVAAGATHAYFGHDEWRACAPDSRPWRMRSRSGAGCSWVRARERRRTTPAGGRC